MEISDEESTKYQAKLAQSLHEDRSSGDSTCDLVLLSQGKEFKVHKNVLMVSSKYFKTMLTTEMKEKYSPKVEIQQIPPDRLSHIIDYIYTGRITVNKDNMLDVYEDADYTQLEDLKLQCSKYVHSVVSFENIWQVQNFAKKHSLEKILEKCLLTLRTNLAHVVQMPDFLNFDSEMITAIIQQTPKDLTKDLFDGIVQWVNYSPDKREQHFGNMFSQLDLSLITPDFLSEMTKQKLIRNNLNCLKRVVDMLANVLSDKTSDTGKLLIVGGETSLKDCFQYDLITKQSEQLPRLKTERCEHASAKVAKCVYVMGGGENSDGKNPRQSCEVLDLNQPTKWEAVSDMLEARDSCRAAFNDGYIYVVGGYNNGSLQSCEKFDVKNDKWTRITDLKQARYGHGLVFCQGLLYCIGGKKSKDRLLTSCERYCMANNEWTEIASLNEGRAYVACVVVNGCIYAIGGVGEENNAFGTVERYTPKDGKWEFVAPLQCARRGHSACVVGSRIVVIGGRKTKSVEVYDPGSDIWTDCFKTNEDFSFATVQSL